ncbi:MAG: hypothetical protein WC829_00830 [Hyphomicrobium sp.]|jgi:hypothetical protein
MIRRRKVDAIRFSNRRLDRAIDKIGMPPRRHGRSRSFFDLFMDGVTMAPRRRR